MATTTTRAPTGRALASAREIANLLGASPTREWDIAAIIDAHAAQEAHPAATQTVLHYQGFRVDLIERPDDYTPRDGRLSATIRQPDGQVYRLGVWYREPAYVVGDAMAEIERQVAKAARGG